MSSNVKSARVLQLFARTTLDARVEHRSPLGKSEV